MATRAVLKANLRPSPTPSRGLGLQGRGGTLVTSLAIATLILCYAWGLHQLRAMSLGNSIQSVLKPLVDQFAMAFEDRWTLPPAIPPFRTGDEPELQEALRANPLLVALVPRTGDRRAWVRQGTRLIRAADSPETRFYLQQADKLEHQGVPFDFPQKPEDPQIQRILTGTCRNDAFAFIRRAEPGSPALDAELAILLGPEPRLLVNLRHTAVPAPPFPSSSHYQVSIAKVVDHTFNSGYWTRTQPMGWHWSFIPAPPLEAAMNAALHGRIALFGAPPCILLTLVLVRVWLKRRHQRRTEAANERLANLLHGIRRPLAVLEARCQSIRSGELSRDASDCELIHIGEEVEHLSLLIENGLKATLGRGASSSGGLVTRVWLASIGEDFEPAFEMAGRSLLVSLEGEGAATGLPALRQVLQGLLENALVHGAGTVRLRSRRTSSRLIIEVSDEGPGLDALALRDLGQPFMRFPGQEPAPEGLGLGLNLALQIAEREGWGVSFATAPGRGFTATLELLTPKPRWWRPHLPNQGPSPRLLREGLSRP